MFTDRYDLMHLKDSEEFLNVRDIITHIHFLENGHWDRFFSNTSHAYGNIFWTPVTLFAWPLYKLEWHGAVMALPRTVSLVAYALCFYVFRKICIERRYSPLQTSIMLLLIASSTVWFFNATILDTNNIFAALLLTSFFLLLKEKSSNRFAVFFFGLALGLKITALYYAPMFFLLLNKNLESPVSLRVLRRAFIKNSWAVLWVAITAAIAYCPTVLAYPFGYTNFVDQGLYYLRVAIDSKVSHSAHQGFWNNLINGFAHYHYQFPLIACGLAAAIFLIWKNRAGRLRDLLIPYIFLMSCLLIILFCLSIKVDPLYVGIYSLPLIFLMPLIFLELRISHMGATFVLLALTTYNYVSRWSPYQNRLLDVHNIFYSESIRLAYERIEFLEKNIKLESTDRILMDIHSVLPAPIADFGNRVRFFYDLKPEDDHTHEPHWRDFNVYAISKHVSIWNSDCENVRDPRLAKDCPAIQRILETSASYITLYSDSEQFVVKSSTNLKNKTDKD